MRKGIVSDVDYTNGMVAVIYSDGEKSTTDLFPCLNTGDEYKMPEIGEMVVVGRLSTGSGVVLGKLWNRGNQPGRSGKGVYHKKLSSTAAISASDTEHMKFEDEDIVFSTGYGLVTVVDIMKRLEALEGKI